MPTIPKVSIVIAEPKPVPTPVTVPVADQPKPAAEPARAAAELHAAPADPENAEERARRYAEAQKHPVVMELLKRFEADIVAREPGDTKAWEERMRRG